MGFNSAFKGLIHFFYYISGQICFSLPSNPDGFGANATNEKWKVVRVTKCGGAVG